MIHGATWMNLNYGEWKKTGQKKYILYDSMIAFGNASQCAMTKTRLVMLLVVIAYVRRKGRGRHKALQGKLRQLPWVMKIFIIWLCWRFHGYIDMSKLMKSYTSNTCSLLDTISLNNSVSFNDQFIFPDITHFEWLCYLSVIKFLNQH